MNFFIDSSSGLLVAAYRNALAHLLPPQPSLAVQVATSMTFSQHPGDDWWQQREERTAALRAEQERVAAYYEEMARQREERENAEAHNGSPRSG
jgi:hypothetical protein